MGIKKINDNKYVIQDTLSIQGEFGIALVTYDIIIILEELNEAPVANASEEDTYQIHHDGVPGGLFRCGLD